MLPALHQACAETTGALWSSRTMIVSPLSSVVTFTPEGMEGISDPLERQQDLVMLDGRIHFNKPERSRLRPRWVWVRKAFAPPAAHGRYGLRKAS